MWTWKILTPPILVTLARDNSKFGWTTYDRVRRLKNEGYLIERQGESLGFNVLQLSKKGFELVRSGLGELKENRFAAQSVPHDFIAMAFQLGSFIYGTPGDVDFFTEQMIQCSDEVLLPVWAPRQEGHVPDGFTQFTIDKCHKVIGFEVELNFKPPVRYTRSVHYYDRCGNELEAVFWLCDGMGLTEKVFNQISETKINREGVHHMFLLDDFKKLGWQASARSGKFFKKTMREIYSQMSTQVMGKMSPKATQALPTDVFFSKLKSPNIQQACATSASR